MKLWKAAGLIGLAAAATLLAVIAFKKWREDCAGEQADESPDNLLEEAAQEFLKRYYGKHC